MKIFLTAIAILVFVFGGFGQEVVKGSGNQSANDEQLFQEIKDLIKDAPSDFSTSRGKILSSNAYGISYQPTVNYFHSYSYNSEITYYIEQKRYELRFTASPSNSTPYKKIIDLLTFAQSNIKQLRKVIEGKRNGEDYIIRIYYQDKQIAYFENGDATRYIHLFSNPPAWIAVNNFVANLSAKDLKNEDKSMDELIKITKEADLDKTFEDLGKSAKEINKSLKELLSPQTDFNTLLKNCQTNAQNREFEKAVKNCSQAISIKKDSGTAYYLRAFSYSKMPMETATISPTGESVKLSGDQRKQFVISDGEKCIQFIPNEYPCYSLIGSFIYTSKEKDELEKAVKNLNEGIRLGDKNNDLYRYRAIAGFKLAQTFNATDANAVRYAEQAISDYTSFLQKDSSDDFIYVNRAEIYRFLSKYDLAIADLSKYLETNQESGTTFLARGQLYMWTKKYQLAIEDFSAALEAFNDELSSEFNEEQKQALALRMQAYKFLKKKKEFCEDLRNLDLNANCDAEWKKK